MSRKPGCGCPQIHRLVEDFMDPDDRDFRKAIILTLIILTIVLI